MSPFNRQIAEALATDVQITVDALSVELSDGCTISVPIGWYPRLDQATTEERKNWRLIGGGRGIHWEQVDEDVSVANLLAGKPSSESPTSLQKWLASRNKPPRRRKKSTK